MKTGVIKHCLCFIIGGILIIIVELCKGKLLKLERIHLSKNAKEASYGFMRNQLGSTHSELWTIIFKRSGKKADATEDFECGISPDI